MDREQFLEVYRHSLAHILAKAVMEIFGRENVQIAIGPQIADGMYYDFLLPRGISTEEFPQIEAKMKEIMKRKEAWTRKEVTKDEALSIFKGQKYKEELIDDLPEGETVVVGGIIPGDAEGALSLLPAAGLGDPDLRRNGQRRKPGGEMLAVRGEADMLHMQGGISQRADLPVRGYLI